MSVKLHVPHLDLDLTLGCGQAFRWHKLDAERWKGPIDDCLVTLRRDGEWLLADSIPPRRGLGRRVATYMRVEDDIDHINARLSADPVMKAGAGAMKGLRIVKMDEWECLVSYVLATFANIPRISKMIDRLATEYGDVIAEGVHAFPSPSQLARASDDELRSCGLGYRAKHVAGICRSVDEKDIAEMRRMPDDDLRNALMALPGVGDKVADCVSLFGFGRLGAFPIDVWIERALSRLYGVEGPYRRLRTFATERFGENAGYAQEYLFYNERVLSGEGGCVFTHPGGSSDRTR